MPYESEYRIIFEAYLDESDAGRFSSDPTILAHPFPESEFPPILVRRLPDEPILNISVDIDGDSFEDAEINGAEIVRTIIGSYAIKDFDLSSSFSVLNKSRYVHVSEDMEEPGSAEIIDIKPYLPGGYPEE